MDCKLAKVILHVQIGQRTASHRPDTTNVGKHSHQHDKPHNGMSSVTSSCMFAHCQRAGACLHMHMGLTGPNQYTLQLPGGVRASRTYRKQHAVVAGSPSNDYCLC